MPRYQLHLNNHRIHRAPQVRSYKKTKHTLPVRSGAAHRDQQHLVNHCIKLRPSGERQPNTPL